MRNITGVISRCRRSHISCNSLPTPPDCISIVHSVMSRVIRKLRLPDYAERRDLRSLPGGLIDTDTSGNLKCVRVKVQPPLPSSPTFPRTPSLVKHEWISHPNCHSICVFTSWRNDKADFRIFKRALFPVCDCSVARLRQQRTRTTSVLNYTVQWNLH